MWRMVVALLLSAGLLTGCGHMLDTNPSPFAEGDYGYGSPGELEPLLERRDAEQVLADRDRMISEITAELSRIVPRSQWLPRRSPTTSPCGEFGSTKGKTYISRHYVSEVPIDAEHWERASQAVIDIAARYGFTDVRGSTDSATDEKAKSLAIGDADGGELTLGSMVAASILVKTGCYLTAEDKRKAREAAPK
jgi:hypothetical protein